MTPQGEEVRAINKDEGCSIGWSKDCSFGGLVREGQRAGGWLRSYKVEEAWRMGDGGGGGGGLEGKSKCWGIEVTTIETWSTWSSLFTP